MKKLHIRFRLLGLMILIMVSGSCNEDFLDRPPEDQLVIDNFYSNPEQVNAATAALYGFPWFTINDKALWSIGDAMSGNLWTNDGNIGQFYTFGVNQNNPHLFEAWESLYRVVAYANSVILNVPQQAGESVSEELINRAVGEGKFMRATAYFYLVRLFGEVPIIEDNSKYAFDPLIPKNRVEDVYTLIERDLKYAETYLAEEYSGRDVGRVTSWAAKTLLAKVYLTLKDYQNAKIYAEDVIVNSGRSLLPNYADLFMAANNNNQESLFALQWMACVDWGTQNTTQAYWARTGELTGVGDGWGGYTSATIDLQNDFEDGDKRRKATYMQYGDFYSELKSADGGYHYDIVNDNEGRGPANTHVKKYVIGSPQDNDGDVCFMSTGINTYMIRLADAYLTYVEAAIGDQAETSDAKALEYFNVVRTRAGLPSKTSVSFLDLLKERRTEFAFESQYWYDLLRYYNHDAQAMINMVSTQEKGTYQVADDWEGDENNPDAYVVNSVNYSLTDDKVMLPIPSTDVDKNPLLAPDVAAEPYQFDE
ncbi:MAG: RagB/SusD family nutrient uptake outer membrane protein [Thalassobius sp.]|nr:RagB/SusD family nutrient uptake outer membrane protein [Thalassovita sp.]